MSITALETLLKPLPDEPWGDKVRRARLAAGLTMDQAAELVSEFTSASHTTIGRLETFTEIPRQRRTRITAIVALIVYKVDPRELGLDLNELPKIDFRALVQLIKRKRPCTTGPAGEQEVPSWHSA